MVSNGQKLPQKNWDLGAAFSAALPAEDPGEIAEMVSRQSASNFHFATAFYFKTCVPLTTKKLQNKSTRI